MTRCAIPSLPIILASMEFFSTDWMYGDVHAPLDWDYGGSGCLDFWW